ncbi:MAG: hypothetical protein RIB45_07735 [Marivibrio sp.]|uniref:hypothetical protein n=1 Tax=Marivibrio sp. TaxID=2039719 RepID=UPI0032EDD2F7
MTADDETRDERGDKRRDGAVMLIGGIALAILAGATMLFIARGEAVLPRFESSVVALFLAWTSGVLTTQGVARLRRR